MTGLVSGSLVSLCAVWVQADLDDRREEQANRQEEVRFVRQMAVDGKIREASFYDADLRDANLSGLDLSGAEFTGADLRGANLTRSDLTDATLTGADLGNARLEDTVLRGADLTGADFPGALLQGVSLAGQALQGSDMSGATLIKVDLEDATLEAADLSGATITHVRFGNLNLGGANLKHATFVAEKDAFDRLTPNDLSEVRFFRTQARGTNFSGALLPKSINTPVSWVSAICYNRFTTWPAGYEPPERRALGCEPIPMPGDEREHAMPFLKPLP